jgi:hypothetical protein
MFRVVALRVLPCLCLFAWWWGGPACPRAAAQQGLPASETDLNKFRDVKARTEFADLLRGDKELTKADLPLLELGAKYYVYRVTLLTLQKKPGELSAVVEDFDSKMKEAKASPKSQAFLKAFAPELVKCFREVLAMDLKQYQVPVVNAGLMLESLGRTGQAAAGDFLASQVKEGKHDIIKYYALKGLRQYFQSRPPINLSENSEDKERLEEVARIQPVIDFVLRSSPLPNNASGEQVAAYLFIRREGIKALAATRTHGIPVLKPKDAVRAPVAYALERVLAEGNAGLSPPASPSEKLEAAIGLCQMQVKIVPRYQPGLMLDLLGRYLLDFSDLYRADHPEFTRPGKEKKTPLLPWKAAAARLKEALKDLETNLVLDAAALKKVRRLQKDMENAFSVINQRKQLEEVNTLRDFLRELPPPNPMVYEGVSEFQIGRAPK